MRYALGIEYDGSEFQGWQRLTHGLTIQAAVESALSTVADETVQVTCSGRTDARVHAACQVVHFDSDVARSEYAWVMGSNTQLPPSVRVLWCQTMAEDFHARYSARARRYRYSILNRPVRPGLQRQLLSWERRPLDATAMHRAAQSILGEHDFSAFRTVHCQARHPIRTVHSLRVERAGERVIIDIQANAFLHHMVRNIVGSLIPIGLGEKPESWLSELLIGKDRNVAGATAAAEGLLFVGPRYPLVWGLPAEVSMQCAQE